MACRPLAGLEVSVHSVLTSSDYWAHVGACNLTWTLETHSGRWITGFTNDTRPGPSKSGGQRQTA